MDTLRAIMKKVEALTNELTLLRVENKALKVAVNSITNKPALMPTQQIKQPNTLTSDDVILNIKKVVNLDYVNNLYRK